MRVLPSVVFVVVAFGGSGAPAQDDSVLQGLTALAAFDKTYGEWISSPTAMAEDWEKLVAGALAPFESKSGAKPNVEALSLRCRLALGESLLFAAVDRLRSGDRRASILHYDRGVRILQEVIESSRPDIDRIPDYSARESLSDGGRRVGRLAGYESIATDLVVIYSVFGRESPIPAETRYERLTTTMRLNGRHGPLESHRARLQEFLDQAARDKAGVRRDYVVRQTTSSDAARKFLADFCPWGAEAYFCLEEAGLTGRADGAGLDYRILRPFETDAPDGRPEVSDVVIRGAAVPASVAAEMARIVGDRSRGNLDAAGTMPIDWDWVAKEPTYVVRWVSPRFDDPTFKDRFEKALKYVGYVFGGWSGLIDEGYGYLEGGLIEGLLKQIGESYGEDGAIYWTSSLLVSAKDAGVLTSDFLLKKDVGGVLPDLSPKNLVEKLAENSFGLLDEFLRRGFYETVDPATLADGKTYDGRPVPPILIRADLLGFQKVPDDQYCRDLHAVRFYAFEPRAVAQANMELEYALDDRQRTWHSRRAAYMKEQAVATPGAVEPIRGRSWRALPECDQNMIVDFAPKCQKFAIEFPAADFKRWTEVLPAARLVATLSTVGEGGRKETIVEAPVETRKLRLSVLNTEDPDGAAAFRDRLMGVGADDLAPPRDDDGYGASDRDGRGAASLETTRRLRSRYLLEVNDARVGQKLGAYELTLDRGRGARHTTTGRLTSPKSGVVLLSYAPAATAAGAIESPTTGDGKVMALIERRETGGYRHKFEPISSENTSPWPKAHVAEDKSGVRKLGIYAFLRWNGRPPGRCHAVRGTITGGIPECRKEFITFVAPRRELDNERTTQMGQDNAMEYVSEADFGNGFLFKIPIDSGIVGRITVQGFMAAYETFASTEKLKVTEPMAKQPFTLHVVMPRPAYQVAPTRLHSVTPAGFVHGSVRLSQCQTGRRLAKVTIGDVSGFCILESKDGVASIEAFEIAAAPSVYEKPPEALKVAFLDYGKPVEVAFLVGSVNKSSFTEYAPEVLKQRRARVDAILRDPNRYAPGATDAWAKLANSLRDRAAILDALEQELVAWDRRRANQELLQMYLFELQNNPNAEPKVPATREEAQLRLDAPYVLTLLKRSQYALGSGAFETANRWTTIARGLAEPHYSHPRFGKDFLREMAYTEREYAKAMLIHKGDLDAARRLWTRYETLWTRIRERAPEPFPYSVDLGAL